MSRSSILCAMLILASCAPSSAHEYRRGNLEIIHPAALPASGDAAETVGFFKIVNDSDEADRLLSVSAPEAAGSAQIILMQPDEPGVDAKTATAALDIPANQETVLAPGGNHIAFTRLSGPLAPDSSFPAVLRFEKAGDVKVMFNVEGRYDPHPHGHGH